MSLKWNGDEAKRLIKEKTAKRLERAAITLENAIKESISEPSNHGSTPSAAGEPPHKDTGRLRGSISHEVDKEALTARVGTNVDYGKFLELGTSKAPAHPFIRPAYMKLRPKLAAIMKGGS